MHHRCAQAGLTRFCYDVKSQIFFINDATARTLSGFLSCGSLFLSSFGCVFARLFTIRKIVLNRKRIVYNMQYESLQEMPPDFSGEMELFMRGWLNCRIFDGGNEEREGGQSNDSDRFIFLAVAYFHTRRVKGAVLICV